MFRTELTIAPATGQLPRTARVLTMGSCFADSIGGRLAANKVETLVNPFGTVFQPLALARLLRAAAGEEVDWQQHLVQARGRWQSYDLHGSIGADSPVELLQTIQELVRRTGEFLRSADVVMLTLGTAWAYRLRETGELVSNCHKQPADLFVRELLTPDEIINGLAETHAYLRRINPELRFVLTVSPVRHLKDTLQLNSVSKSVLRLATHIVSDLLPGVAYFPAYELLVDDLRDYRFYASDMLHPSTVAEDYVWEKFARAYFDADFGRFRKEWAGVRQSLEHRPLYAGAPEHRQFLENTREKLEQLSLRKVDVDAELAQVRAQLAALPVPQQPEPVATIEDDEERIDIGETDTEVSVPTPAVSLTEERAPRLSPEEFRAQRAARQEQGRRDGRDKNRKPMPTENEQFQQALPANVANDTTPVDKAELSEVSSVAAKTLPQPAPASESTAAEELVRKKKRRSRGGAKRTARKNALRLAAGEAGFEAGISGEAGPAGTGQDMAAENATSQPTVPKKSSVITKSVPVKRGGRREEQGRVPRVPLFTAVNAPSEGETASTVDAELPTPPIEQVSAVPSEETVEALPVEATTAARKGRNSRNRKKQGANRPESAEGNDSQAVEPAVDTSALPMGTATELASDAEAAPASANDAETPIVPAIAVAALATEPVGATATGPEANTTQTTRQPRRSKGRAISGARTEKPAIDTPIIPVPEHTAVRTQVAAGRMMGSSASLVTPTAAPKKAVAKKPAAKATPEKAIPTPVPAAPTPNETVSEIPAATAEPAPQPEPTKAPKAKAAATKPVAKKPATPKKAAKETEAPVVEAPAAELPKVKAASAKPAAPKKATKPAAKRAAPKPKTPTKPNTEG